jgi:hypothetical protein
MRIGLSSMIVLSMSAYPLIAAAQPAAEEGEAPPSERAFAPHLVFLEISGNWGAQFGVQQYLPEGMAGTTEHPLTNGFGGGATVGAAVARNVDVFVDYTHGDASSRNGDITGVLDKVNGSIAYDAFAAGARLAHDLGPGRLYGQLAVGIVLPFDTVVTYDYAPTLAPAGIMGSGTDRERYNTGVGGHGELGYQVAITEGLYVGLGVRLQTFQSSNDGQRSSLQNFVVDFNDPRPVTIDVQHGTNGGATPTTYSVQDARLHLAIGYQF